MQSLCHGCIHPKFTRLTSKGFVAPSHLKHLDKSYHVGMGPQSPSKLTYNSPYKKNSCSFFPKFTIHDCGLSLAEWRDILNHCYGYRFNIIFQRKETSPVEEHPFLKGAVATKKNGSHLPFKGAEAASGQLSFWLMKRRKHRVISHIFTINTKKCQQVSIYVYINILISININQYK